MNREEKQKRRAQNLVWNAAGDYGIRTPYLAYDEHGEADVYWNYVIGAANRRFDFSRLEKMFSYLEAQKDGAVYAELFWLGLEASLYEGDRAKRPALDAMRKDWAVSFLNEKNPVGSGSLIRDLKEGRCRRILGQPDGLEAPEKEILDALDFPGNLSEDEVMDRMDRIFSRWFFQSAFREFDELGGHIFSGSFLLPRIFRKKGQALRMIDWQGDQEGEKRSAGKWTEELENVLTGKNARKEAVRAYVESCFGESVLTKEQTRQLEALLCTGPHKGCLLHVTDGEFPKEALTQQERWQQDFVSKRREMNERWLKEHEAVARIAVAKMTERIRNAILQQQDEDRFRKREGRLAPGLLWRNRFLGDEKVFVNKKRGQAEELKVDLLLDASASQREQQPQVAMQGYVIAESLSRCNIPVRVSAFCSVSGCTVLQLLKKEESLGGGRSVLRYVCAGWNRDGLAFRTLGHLIKSRGGENRLLIILSDASPNDDQKIAGEGKLSLRREYGGKEGVQDAAAEIRALKGSGLRVICVFTGTDRELDNAREIYGRDLVRIPSIGWFADAVGKVLADSIREI